jgi:hypothetical protein
MDATGQIFKYNRVHPTIRTGIFLHSWWVPGMNSDYAFLPLPSQAIKAGKISRTGLSSQSVQEYSRAIAMGYPNIPPEYPILGKFLSVMYKLGASPREERVDYVARHKPYKVLGSADPDYKMNLPAIFDMIEERYGITHKDIERVEAKMDAVTSLPWIISDDVFLRLQEKDY